MRLRQVALVASALEPVVEDLCAVLGVEVAYHDPGVGVFGLRNALLPVGDTFLEVVSPERPGTTAGRWLERRGGDAGYMVIVQTDDLDAARRRAASVGVRIVWEATLEDAATIHLHPRDVGGAILSLDAMHPPGSWRWAGPAWRDHVRTQGVKEIVGVALESSEPAAMAARWSEVLERPVRSGDAGERRIALDGGAIRFVPGEDAGVCGVDLRAVDPCALRERARARGLEAGPDGIRIGGVLLRLV